eukprot:CAMPEP_0169153988 /NCGR_PEP_ID=MMETSP1015-20121227/52447_1 /TAXON_ID=342587 /ORGANISM="Karlodinium micrum, Strain CCMP2283" /LENGTH=35 /DNA_ID= /DNA_START= /DNA_END= /DNA_ORIENTATION=
MEGRLSETGASVGEVDGGLLHASISLASVALSRPT